MYLKLTHQFIPLLKKKKRKEEKKKKLLWIFQTCLISNRFWKWPVTLFLNRKSLPKIIKVNI